MYVGEWGDTLYAINGTKIIGDFAHGDHHFYLDSVLFYPNSSFGNSGGAVDMIKSNYKIIIDSTGGTSSSISFFPLFPVMNGDLVFNRSNGTNLDIWGWYYDPSRNPPKINGRLDIAKGNVFIYNSIHVKQMSLANGVIVKCFGKGFTVTGND
jgi:hypothetical protein